MLYERYGKTLPRQLITREAWHPYPVAAERAAWAKVPADLRAAHLAATERLLGTPWPELPATLFLEFARDGNRSHFESPHFTRRNRLSDLVLAECFAGEGRFVDEIVNGVWHLCEESYWGLPAHVGMQRAGSGLPDTAEPTVDLFAAETGALLAWTWYLLGPQLGAVSPLLGPRVQRELQTRILTPCRERDDFWWMGFHSRHINNWNPWINSNWLAIALLAEDQPRRRLATVRRILRSLDRFIEAYPADGGCDEGPGYWSRAGASLFDALELLHSATGGALDVFGEPLIGEIGRFIYRVQLAGRWFVNFADAPPRPSPPAPLVFRYGQRIHDEAMQRFAASVVSPGDFSQRAALGSLARALPALGCLPELLATPAIPALPRDVWLPETQVMVARAATGSTAGLTLAAKGGHNAESHNHNDVGHFILFADGRPVLIDVGVETYSRKTFSAQRYDIWTMQSQYHNLPTINGVGQAPGREFAARDVGYQATNEVAAVTLDLAGAYPAELGLRLWRRRLELQRAGELRLDDTWEMAVAPQELFVSLITPCVVTAPAPGRLHLAAGPLPGNESTGAADVSFPAEAFTAEREELAVTDGHLAHVWGDRLCRIKLRWQQPAVRGSLTVRIQQVTKE